MLLRRNDERLDPSSRVFTVLARISERGFQTLFIRSFTTKIEMTCKSWTQQKNKTFIFPYIDEDFILLHFNNQRLKAGKVSVVLYAPFDKWVLFILFHSCRKMSMLVRFYSFFSRSGTQRLLFVFFTKQSVHSFEVELLRWIVWNNNKAAKFL